MKVKSPKLLAVIMTLFLIVHSAIAQSDDKAAKVDALLAGYSKPDAPGASVMIIKDAKILYAKGFGLANLEDHIAVTTSTNFRLASFTKQFTAMAIMIIADRKQLSLDAHLTDFFPEFPAYGHAITIRHLLNHTSGLLDYGDLITTGTTMPVLDRDVLWIMEQQDRTAFPPGTRFQYSNTGYALLSVIVERISGETFAAFMKRNIFDPLNMAATLVNERGISSIPNRADGYSTTTLGGFRRTDQSLTSYVMGDGGVYSSVSDLYKWDQSLYTTQLVGSDLLEQAFTAGKSTQEGQKAGYGFGWLVGQYRGLKLLYHSGGTVGFSTMIKRFIDQKFTVIMLANRNPADAAHITDKIADLYLFDSNSPASKTQISEVTTNTLSPRVH